MEPILPKLTKLQSQVMKIWFPNDSIETVITHSLGCGLSMVHLVQEMLTSPSHLCISGWSTWYGCHDSWHQIRWPNMWWVRWPVTGLFYDVWSHVLFWKLYIVPTLRELTSLSLNINFNTLINMSSVWGRPVTGGPAYKLSPSLLLGSQFRLWGNWLLQWQHHDGLLQYAMGFDSKDEGKSLSRPTWHNIQAMPLLAHQLPVSMKLSRWVKCSILVLDHNMQVFNGLLVIKEALFCEIQVWMSSRSKHLSQSWNRFRLRVHGGL